MADNFAGARIVSFESRRQNEMATLIKKTGGQCLSAPSMQEVELEAQTAAFVFADALAAGQVDGIVLLTGVGTRWLLNAANQRLGVERTAALLKSMPLYCRGPKPVAALKEFGLRPTLVAPEPNTWRELLATLQQETQIAGKRLHIQEYGAPAEALNQALQQLGALTVSVPIYAWQLPDDQGPLEQAVRALVSGEAEGALFTAAQQVEHVRQVAERLGLWPALQQALLKRVCVASIGPVTTEALERHGLVAHTAPEHPKMGQLVTHLARNWTTFRRQPAH